MITKSTKKGFIVLLSLLFTFSMILSACSSGSSSSQDKGSDDKDTKANDDNNKGGKEELADKQELHLTAGDDIRSMDSAKPSDTQSVSMLSRTQSGLLVYNGDMELVPDLAKDMPKASDDKTEYTFNLRNAEWSDGSPITADQFVYAWRRTIDPDTKSTAAHLFASANIKNAAKIIDPDSNMYGKMKKLGVEALDKHTLKVTLSKPTPDRYFSSFMTSPGFFPLKKEFVERQGDNYAQEPNYLLYSGPFKLKKWNHGDGWTFEKNDKYWNADKVNLDKVNYKIVKSDDTVLKLYNAGKIDYAQLTSENVDKYKDSDEFHQTPKAGTFYWLLNYNKVPEFKNTKLRQAMWLSMDRKSGADIILNNGSYPAYYLVPKGFAKGPNGNQFHEKNGPADLKNYPDMDKDKAKELWEEAKDELGIKKLDIEILTTDTPKGEDLAQYYVNQVMKNLKGLNITIKKVPFKSYLDRLDKGDCDICGGSGWGADYEDPIAFLEIFKTGNPENKLGFSDKKYDQMLEKAGNLGDQPEKRWEFLQKADKYLADNAAYIPTYQAGFAILIKSYVEGFHDKKNSIGPEEFYRYAKILKH